MDTPVSVYSLQSLSVSEENRFLRYVNFSSFSFSFQCNSQGKSLLDKIPLFPFYEVVHIISTPSAMKLPSPGKSDDVSAKAEASKYRTSFEDKPEKPVGEMDWA